MEEGSKMRRFPIAIESRINHKIKAVGECRLWRGAIDRAGHGVIVDRGKVYRVRKLTWELCFGQIPEGVRLYQLCTNSHCIRTTHLRLGQVEDRIARHVTPQGECRVWAGKIHQGRDARARTRWNGKNHYVPRIVWELAHGSIPEGMVVCHACDNSLCLRTSHLFLGSQEENVRDRNKKGRDNPRTGRTHHDAKLDEEKVRHIREVLVPQGLSRSAIAKMYGVSKPAIKQVALGRTWKHVKSGDNN